ncbi:MAG: hypothetical protein GY861_08325 [bacterium]|nr:hypothetical protein [bacterium]
MAKMDDKAIVDYINSCRKASKEYKHKRTLRNRANWNMYNYRQDYSKKKKGQSKEFIPKLSLGIKYFKSMLATGLTNRSDDWFMVEKGRFPDDVFTADVVYALLKHYLYLADAKAKIPEIGKYVALDGTVCVKVGGVTDEIDIVKNVYKDKAPEVNTEGQLVQPEKEVKYKEDVAKKWRLVWDIVNFNDWYPDMESPVNDLICDTHDINMDYYKLVKLAEQYPKSYRKKVISEIKQSFERDDEKSEKDNQLNKSRTGNSKRRKNVVLTEFWGDILNKDYELEHENVICVVANDKYLIRMEPNKRLDKDNPLVHAALFPTEDCAIASEALADAPAELNKMYNEITNLLIDCMFGAAKGVYQYRRGYAAKPHALSRGVTNGKVIEVKRDMPLGVQILERIKTGEVPQDSYAFYKEMEQALNEAMLMNDMKMGNVPQGSSVKATTAMIADQASTGMFSSIFNEFEDNCIVPLLEKSWCEILENIDQDSFTDELQTLVGKETAAKIKAMEPKVRYTKGANAVKFTVRGISGYIQRIREFQKISTLAGQIFSNPALAQEFMKDYSVSKLLGQLISGTGVRDDQVKLDDQEKATAQINAAVGQAIAGAMEAGTPPKGKPEEINKLDKPTESPLPPAEGNAGGVL